MDELERELAHGKMKRLVFSLLGVGVIVLALGVFMVLRGRGSADADAVSDLSEPIQKWCELRRQWAKEVDPMAADIGLKSIRPADKQDKDALEQKRSEQCANYANKVKALGVDDENVTAIEVALVKEGKMRANVEVEIHNALTLVDSSNIKEVRSGFDDLSKRIKSRIIGGQAKADQELSALLAKLPGCRGIYRGPLTTAGASGNPYISWQELEIRRKQAEKRLDAKVKALEPQEEFANQVYHELISKYRPTIVRCYTKHKARNPQMSESMDLRVRLNKNGTVRTLGIEKMDVPDERLLDCMLANASRWRLPQPLEGGEVVVVALDFSRI